MKKTILAACLFTSAAFCGLAYGADSIAAPIIKTLDMKTSDGKDAGYVRLTQTKAGVLLELNMHNIPPGELGFHIHEKGDCSPPDTFANAGGHLNPDGHPHGYMVDNGPQDGDMPNVSADHEGQLKQEIFNPSVTMDPNDTSKRAQLLDADGFSIIVHEQPDDYMSQPAGNAGARIACGAILR